MDVDPRGQRPPTRPEEVLGPGGLLAAAFPGYEHRPGQLEMAARIARALWDDERLLVEAGTGTGKTLAYLVPAVLSGRKVVVSTATKTLQDQIARVDLPRLASVLPGPPLSFAVTKGLANYVCRRRLAAYERQTVLPAGVGGGGADTAFVRLRAWVDATGSGDRSDLPDLPDDSPHWREIASSPETRVGARCPFNDVCFVTAMRRRAADAQIVVTNHHLFFADLALRAQWPDAEVLPPYEAVIFDEAHQIEDIAGEFFGVHVSTQRLGSLARDLGRAAALHPLRAGSLSARLGGAAGGFADAVRDALPRLRSGEEARVPVPEGLWSGPALGRYHALDAVLEEIGTWLDPDGAAVREAARAAPELGALGRRAEALRADLSLLIDGAGAAGSGADAGARARGASGGRGGSDVRWIAAGPRGVGLHAAPVDVGPILSEAFGRQPGPLVFTSATLTVAGSFGYLRQRLGLGDTAAEASFPSPFRYAEQALLYVAVDLPEPGDNRFPAAAAVRAAELCRITGGRALLLFTSFKNLHLAARHLRQELSLPVLVQGERPRHVLLDELRGRVGSVLLGTQSFWEGVDVPGEALSLVAIDRLPFDVPEDPLTAARIGRLREDGEDPFGAYQVPRASLALKQGFGRLIRTRADAGIVALLDGRILRRSYGGTLLASLPRDCPRTESLADVAAFWSRVRGGA
jgi:ATP-dependent DNA helicase DinG